MAPDEDWSPDIFNSDAYAALHAARFPATLRLVRHGYAFHAALSGPGVFTSPGCAPYGGFDVSPDVDLAGFDAFSSAAERGAHMEGATRLEITLAPLCYAPGWAPARLASLCRRGYVVCGQELNQAIPVGPAPFADQAAYATRKRLAKAVRAGVTAGLVPAGEHQAAYDAIADNRRKKGRTLSMAWADVKIMAGAFPDRVHLFAAKHDGEVLAAALCIAVNPRVLYVHAWGERAGAEPLSPVSLLAAEAYGFARARGFGLLDLGTSSAGGQVDAGLHAFKRSLGATPSLKLRLSRALA